MEHELYNTLQEIQQTQRVISELLYIIAKKADPENKAFKKTKEENT